MDTKEKLSHLMHNVSNLAKKQPAVMQAYTNFNKTIFSANHLQTAQKELIAVAVAVYTQCEWCIAVHVNNALKAGNSEDQILEAATVAFAFGAGPSVTHSAELVQKALNDLKNTK